MLKSILAQKSTSISEFKKNPMAAMEESAGEPIAVLNHNQPAFYCLSQDHYQRLLEQLDELELIRLANERKSLEHFEVKLNEL